MFYCVVFGFFAALRYKGQGPFGLARAACDTKDTDDGTGDSPLPTGRTALRLKLIFAALAGTVILAGCETWKTESSCDQDADRLKATVTTTAAWLEAVRPEIEAGYRALADCNRISEPCDAELWLARSQTMRTDLTAVQARFSRAVDLWRPEACLPYVRGWQMNPPDPEVYRGYYFTLSETGDQLDELIDRFGRRVR